MEAAIEKALYPTDKSLEEIMEEMARAFDRASSKHYAERARREIYESDMSYAERKSVLMQLGLW